MSLAHIRSEIQRALLAALNAHDGLYRVGEDIPATPEQLDLAARATELVLLAMRRAEIEERNARRASRAPKPPPGDQRPEAKPKNGGPKGLIGRPAREIVEDVD
jgi:hypothetical protein